MKELFLETPQGRLPLNIGEIQKYNLEKGLKSPFTGYPIVDRNGDSTLSKPQKKSANISDEESQMLTTSEVIDFMQGADSSDA